MILTIVFVALIIAIGYAFVKQFKWYNAKKRELYSRAQDLLRCRTTEDLIKMHTDKSFKSIRHLIKTELSDRGVSEKSGFYRLEEDAVLDGISLKKGEHIWISH